jgi:hypothetical protein
VRVEFLGIKRYDTLVAVAHFTGFTYRLTSAMSPRKPYGGSERNLVLAFDVGTTYSGISYSILDPGLVPQVMTVTKYRFYYCEPQSVPTNHY